MKLILASITALALAGCASNAGKAKEVADALLAMVTPERDALTQDGKPND